MASHAPRSGLKEEDYKVARYTLEAGDVDASARLSRDTSSPPEMLYYLAEHGDTEARKGVAGNRVTPDQANRMLVDDDDIDVRGELARKIAGLMPGIKEEAAEELRENAIEIIEILARDQAVRVRKILATELCQCKHVPKHIILTLAKDEHIDVAAPVLEYSPLLNKADLTEILAAGVVKGVGEAIARRRGLSDEIAGRIVASLDIPAITALLLNPSARLREKTMVRIVDAAENEEALHSPMCMRPNLSLRVMKRIAGFVATVLVEKMVEASDIDADTGRQILVRARHRIDNESEDDDDLAQRAREFSEQGMLNDKFIVELIRKGRRPLVLHCVGEMAGIHPDQASRILESRNGRPITALAYRAGLSMRTALEFQNRLATVPPERRVNARNGTEYPLSGEEMQGELQLFLG